MEREDPPNGSTIPPLVDVAVVGMGASGTLFSTHLLERGSALTLLALERTGRFGPGMAYSTRCPSHLLNVPAGRMSAYSTVPDHFYEWLRRVEPTARPDDFPERRRYGQYLAFVLARAMAKAERAQLSFVHTEVDRLTERHQAVRLALSNGTSVRARVVVLALGNPPPRMPRVLAESAIPRVRLIRSPWASEFAEIGPDERVLLVGTGLTMVDAALALGDRGHRGPLIALSRHGLFPTKHRPSASLEVPLPEPSLRALWRMLRSSTRHQDGGWRSGIDALRPHTQALWGALPLAERRRFLRHAQAYWNVHRHRMAPAASEQLSALRDRGQLQLLAGRILGGHLSDDGVAIRYRPRGAQTEQVLAVDRIINCTGPSALAGDPGQPLLRQLISSGRARLDPTGLGLATDGAGALLDGAGRLSGRLFTLGPLRKGELWESTAIPEIRAQAEALAERVVEALSHGRGDKPVDQLGGLSEC